MSARTNPAAIDPHRARQLSLSRRQIESPEGIVSVLVDDAESPLAWLARRKGRDGRALIEPIQHLAGERLRADFTRAQMTPRLTTDWSGPMGGRSQGAQAINYSDAAIAARQRLRRALDATGPEFAGLLLDVCCFLKTLADIERERGWPARSAKVVLQLGLDRLARHYGFAGAAMGQGEARTQTWLAPDAGFGIALMPADAE